MRPNFGHIEDENGLPPVSKLSGVAVQVRNNNVDQAMRTLKKKMLEENVLKDFQRKEAYVPRTVQRRKDAAEAKRRWQKKLKMMSDPQEPKTKVKKKQ